MWVVDFSQMAMEPPPSITIHLDIIVCWFVICSWGCIVSDSFVQRSSALLLVSLQRATSVGTLIFCRFLVLRTD